MNEKKAEMGMGTLIIFIALILVAAIAASVLIATTVKLQNKALDTGKMTTYEVGTALTAVEVYAENGSADNNVNYFFETIKLSAGSEPIRFEDLLVTMSLAASSRDYGYASGQDCLDPGSWGANNYGIVYQINGSTHTDGYLNKGDVAKLCFEAPSEVNESQDVKISMVPKVGSILVVETSTPDLMVDKRISIFP